MTSPNDKPRVATGSLIAGALVLVAIAFSAGHWFAQRNVTAVSPPTVAGFLWPPPPAVDHLQLIDKHGAVFDQTRLDDHWTLVFFGYTHCPDICPTTMATLKQVRAQLVGHAAFERKGQVLFISVDAARDTPDVLRAYTEYFNPDFLAAAVPDAERYRLTEQFGIEVTKSSGATAGEYYYDHPAYILLIGPDRRIIGVFTPPLEAPDIAAQVRTIVVWGELTE